MREIALKTAKDRAELFENTASRMGINAAVVEKDFWVVWTLDYLFHRCHWSNSLAFKGGTSLSKAYNLISRFSEDIDLILDWRVLGYGKDEPWEKRSYTKQDKFNKEANERAAVFLQDDFVPALQVDLSKELESQVELKIDKDGQTVMFSYPRGFSDEAILQEIRLEIGALAAWTPAAEKQITSYAAEQYSRLFSNPSTSVLTVLPERTFWEKATILHREANRPADCKSPHPPQRYSRHYYDLYCMAQTDVKEQAFSDFALLQKVAVFKNKFYRCAWAKYDDAKPGTMKLQIPDHNKEILREDYFSMGSMLFRPTPEFDELMDGIRELEAQINNIKVQ